MSPLIPDMLWCLGVGRSGSSPYRRVATAVSTFDLSTRQFRAHFTLKEMYNVSRSASSFQRKECQATQRPTQDQMNKIASSTFRAGDLFEKKQNDFEDKLNDEEKEALVLFKGKILTFVQDMVKGCPIEIEEQKRTFKRAFVLFIQKSFLLPTSSA
ncbi:hypothetical protein PIB30_081397 [Stylosanthes scabra]|uniref:Uncharacterized protein n=1 Tax=Stylosanthes scabra TaxID=79078 RepID=A0ABU6ZQF4_9FABA|nr:hypothetical protein [Stylosanthes scabra]